LIRARPNLQLSREQRTILCIRRDDSGAVHHENLEPDYVTASIKVTRYPFDLKTGAR
jgi:hypothetical protein